MTSAGSLYQQLQYNTSPGPDFEPGSALPEEGPSLSPAVRLIAYYLPQFHAIPENDAWWGNGFTEWANVTKAYPRYLGHRQPRLPADLGFYDLRRPDVLRSQAALAARAGIYGFCIHHYWFSGRTVLESPLETILNDPTIDLRFCLNWANENWTRRWDGHDNDVLLGQSYHAGDAVAFMKSILRALRDPRYIRISGRPLIMVYKASMIPNAEAFFAESRQFLKSEGVGDPYLVMAQVHDDRDPTPYGLDAAAGFPPHNNGFRTEQKALSLHFLDPEFDGAAFDYGNMVEAAVAELRAPAAFKRFPGVCPGWDNEARRPGRGVSFFNASPPAYADWLAQSASYAAQAAEPDERIVFINAWNEWAEGAVLEPDRHYGHAYLVATRQVADRAVSLKAVSPEKDAIYGDPSPNLSRRVRNAVQRKVRTLSERLR